MNVYDFDGTICRDDTEIDFFYYMLKRHPINWLRIPYYLCAHILYKKGKIDEKEYRHRTYLTLKNMKNIDSVVIKFWKNRKHKMMDWYIKQKKDDDLIISATPRFLLEPFLIYLNIKNYIVSEFDLTTRRFVGEINVEEYKVYNFLKKYKKEDIDAFYTDSMRDLPMILISKKAYIIKNNLPVPYSN